MSTDPAQPARTLTFPELAQARRATETISKFLQSQLVIYLETLRPLFEPERLLGKYAGGKSVAAHGEKALAQIQQSYQALAGKPFDLPREFEAGWVAHIDSTLELYRWDYVHEALGGAQPKQITMTHPARWVLGYKSGATLAQVARGLVSRSERQPELMKQFVVNALVLNGLVARNTGLTTLLTALRFDVRVEELPGFGKLPLVTITAQLPTFRPADDLILAAVSFSGVPAFIELIDLETVRSLEDPLKVRIEALLAADTP
jgi:hypothetical protein